ncbi:MAG: hypothetical protein M3297_01020, partial [Thermoproteota archaeon]|nr:hypothetical protein [Thermoproteota archaeon]
LQAEGEAQAITIIDEQLRNNPTYLEWLKSTKWDGKLPLVTGGQGSTPFIDIPTSADSNSNTGQAARPAAASNGTGANS